MITLVLMQDPRPLVLAAGYALAAFTLLDFRWRHGPIGTDPPVM